MSTDFLVPCQWCVSTRKCESAWTVATAKCPEVDRVAHAFNCPLSPPVRYGFLDDFARTRALPFIAASSADTDQQIRTCLENNVPNTNLLRRHAVSCEFVKTECVAILAFSPLDNAVVLTFRGTNGPVQVLIEAINIAIYAQKDFEPVGGKVVANFYDAFFKLWKAGLEVDLRQTMFQHPTAELWVFGHSLGGSIASLAAAWIARLGLIGTERIRFVSFGQPRTGNLEFAQTFDNLVPYKYRVVHKGDCVSKLPARIPITDSSLFHHRYEVWYNNNMLAGDAYEVCESADSSACSGSVTDPESLSSTNHLQYYNDLVLSPSSAKEMGMIDVYRCMPGEFSVCFDGYTSGLESFLVWVGVILALYCIFKNRPKDDQPRREEIPIVSIARTQQPRHVEMPAIPHSPVPSAPPPETPEPCAL
ncbi:lipase (class 3) domain-containing protein [Ditylenchus destructor]|uniref:Lipase (Class 3) domain-containing protein n=1 Tax=Ditylenchus destructor TaxID=166010 RepID=A0AAD4NCZ3_9BILA|nr:lipase (class 3) domain-containing protein [Ditylenchus destructor]